MYRHLRNHIDIPPPNQTAPSEPSPGSQAGSTQDQPPEIPVSGRGFAMQPTQDGTSLDGTSPEGPSTSTQGSQSQLLSATIPTSSLHLNDAVEAAQCLAQLGSTHGIEWPLSTPHLSPGQRELATVWTQTLYLSEDRHASREEPAAGAGQASASAANATL